MAAKLVEVVKELALLTGLHAVIRKMGESVDKSDLTLEEQQKRRALASALAIAAITSTRWRESNRRLLAIFLLVRSYNIYRDSWANKNAIAITFCLTAGELGRRWMDWPNEKMATLHHQFITVMGNLAGAGDWTKLAQQPVQMSKNWTLKHRFQVALNSTKFTVPLLLTAYGLQEVIKACTHLYKARKKRIAIRSESPGHRGLEFADRYSFDAVKFAKKVVRTSAMYVFLGSYTVLLQTKGIVAGSHKDSFFSWRSLQSNILFFSFGIFGLEPFSRGRILAEYYVAHLTYGLWSDAKRLFPGIRNLDKLALSIAMATAVLSERHQSLSSHLAW